MLNVDPLYTHGTYQQSSDKVALNLLLFQEIGFESVHVEAFKIKNDLRHIIFVTEYCVRKCFAIYSFLYLKKLYLFSYGY